tara:strand:- start:1896 stop:2381 length:486 start_codon:yes stop_codon:yes gene_type:complete
MGLQKGLILLVFLSLSSCGSKKKTVIKENKETKIVSSYTSNAVIDKILTDSSTTFLNIVSLNIVAQDSTKPIQIIDYKGNITTFRNVRSINTSTDKSVVKNKIKKHDKVVQTSTAGVTTTIKENSIVKEKFKLDTTFIYVIIAAIILFLLRKHLRRFIFPI